MERIMKSVLVTVTAGFLCIGVFTEGHVFAADQGPCAQDIAKFCKDVKPGGGAIRNCLEAHEGQLTAACKEHEAKMEKTRVEWREKAMQQRKFQRACKVDMAKYCKNVPATPEAQAKCLKTHEKELLPHCNESIKEMVD